MENVSFEQMNDYYLDMQNGISKVPVPECQKNKLQGSIQESRTC